MDIARRQTVAATRHGRPVAVVQACEDYLADTQALPAQVARWISANYPLRGQEAADSMRKHLASLPNLAAKDDLSEDDVARLLNEE